MSAAMGEDIEKLKEAVWTGNGKPGLVTRMESIEVTVKALVKAAWLLFAAGLTMFGTVIAGIVIQHWK